MSGVYGDMMSFFPELIEQYDVFYMRPSVGAGYGNRVLYKTVDGYLARDRGGDIAGITDLMTENQKASFFAYATIPTGDIEQGLFVEDSGQIFRFTFNNTYANEGGCSEYRLQLVSGNTDKQVSHDYVNLGVGEFQ